MKKLIYIFLFALVSAATITSCTEEEVLPNRTGGTGSGGMMSDGPF